MRVRAPPLDLPLSTRIATAQATLTTAPLVLADGHTDQGIVGMGQAPRPCRSYRHLHGPTHSPTLSSMRAMVGGTAQRGVRRTPTQLTARKSRSSSICLARFVFLAGVGRRPFWPVTRGAGVDVDFSSVLGLLYTIARRRTYRSTKLSEPGNTGSARDCLTKP
jgi:hypothetical protein